MIVKKNRKEFAWQFPQGLIEEGETIRGAAEREFEEECNVQKKLQTHFTGRGPCHYISYAYPPELQKKYNTYGCKVCPCSGSNLTFLDIFHVFLLCSGPS